MKKAFKITGAVIVYFGIVPFLALITNFLSAFITWGSDFSQKDTVGIITHHGFPVWFLSEAPGISIMSSWHFNRFLINIFIWFLIFMSIALVTHIRTGKRKDPDNVSHGTLAINSIIKIALTALATISSILIWIVISTSDRTPHRRGPICMINLSQVGKACAMYSMEHNDRFPDELGQLTPKYLKNTNIFFCPCGQNTNAPLKQYDIVPNLSETNGPTSILAHCPLGSHEAKGGYVLFVDGSVSWYMTKQDPSYKTNQSQSFEEIIKKGRE